MPKLCETIAILKGVKSRAYALTTQRDKLCQKPAQFNGMSKSYEPLNEDDPDKPDGETALVQNRVDDVMAEMTELLADMFDTTATQEVGNTIAKADIVVDGTVLAANMPATYLLFLEKQLTDLHTAVSRLPTLPTEFAWSFSKQQDCWVSETVRKVRTKKTPRVVMTATTKTTAKDGTVTEQETGQVLQEDLPVGYWNTTYLSSALPPAKRKALADRVTKLQRAVKEARERANGVEIEKQQIGQKLLDWVFA
jgi:hypothetical protein